MVRRLQGRIDPADVVQETYLTVRGKFPQYSADPRLPFFLWLRLEVGQTPAMVAGLTDHAWSMAEILTYPLFPSNDGLNSSPQRCREAEIPEGG
jgi:hypothetical protein